MKLTHAEVRALPAPWVQSPDGTMPAATWGPIQATEYGVEAAFHRGSFAAASTTLAGTPVERVDFPAEDVGAMRTARDVVDAARSLEDVHALVDDPVVAEGVAAHERISAAIHAAREAAEAIDQAARAARPAVKPPARQPEWRGKRSGHADHGFRW